MYSYAGFSNEHVLIHQQYTHTHIRTRENVIGPCLLVSNYVGLTAKQTKCTAVVKRKVDSRN